jgi:hypothetical protein
LPDVIASRDVHELVDVLCSEHLQHAVANLCVARLEIGFGTRVFHLDADRHEEKPGAARVGRIDDQILEEVRLRAAVVSTRVVAVARSAVCGRIGRRGRRLRGERRTDHEDSKRRATRDAGNDEDQKAFLFRRGWCRGVRRFVLLCGVVGHVRAG